MSVQFTNDTPVNETAGRWRTLFPPAELLRRYQHQWLRHDIVAGATAVAAAG